MWLYISVFPSSGRVELIAAGVAVGSAAVVVGEQLLLAVAGRHWGGLIVVGIALAVRRWTARGSGESCEVPVAELVVSIGIGLIALSVDWLWSLPSGVLVLVAGLLMVHLPATRTQRHVRLALAVMLLVGAAAVSLVRPRGWWLNSLPDYAWFEGLAKGLAEFGTVGPGGVDLKISYHWFAYAWAGLITRWAGVGPWLVLTRAAPLLIAATISLLVYAIAFRGRAAKSRADWLLVALVCCSGSMPIWYGQIFRLLRVESFSAIAGLMWILVVPLALQRSTTLPWPSRYVTAGLFVVVSFLAKTAFGAVAFVYFVGAVAIDLGRGRVGRMPALAALAASALAVLASFRFLIYDPATSVGWSRRLGSFSFLWRLEAEYLMFSRVELGGLALIWALGVVGPLVVIVAARAMTQPRDAVEILPGIVALGCAIAALCLIDMTFAEMVYGVYAAWVMLMPQAVRSCSNALSDGVKQIRTVTSAGLLAGVVGSIVTFLVPVPPGSTKGEILLRDLPHLGVIATTGVLILALVCAARSVGRRELVAAASISALVFSSLLTVQTSIRGLVRGIPSVGHATLNLAGDVAQDVSLTEATRWMRDYVPSSDVIATTIGQSTCLSRVSISSTCWDPLASRESFFALDVLAANLASPMILRSSYPAAKTIGKPVAETLREERRRREAILDFARMASIQATRVLRTYGVRWMLIERATTTRESWGPYGSISFANQDFVIVRLMLE
jgi:hypothetical protein